MKREDVAEKKIACLPQDKRKEIRYRRKLIEFLDNYGRRIHRDGHKRKLMQFIKGKKRLYIRRILGIRESLHVFDPLTKCRSLLSLVVIIDDLSGLH